MVCDVNHVGVREVTHPLVGSKVASTTVVIDNHTFKGLRLATRQTMFTSKNKIK